MTVRGPGAASRPGAPPSSAGLPVDFSCRVPPFDIEAGLGRGRTRRLDRFSHLALAAARRAVADAGLDARTWDGERVGVPSWQASPAG